MIPGWPHVGCGTNISTLHTSTHRSMHPAVATCGTIPYLYEKHWQGVYVSCVLVVLDGLQNIPIVFSQILQDSTWQKARPCLAAWKGWAGKVSGDVIKKQLRCRRGLLQPHCSSKLGNTSFVRVATWVRGYIYIYLFITASMCFSVAQAQACCLKSGVLLFELFGKGSHIEASYPRTIWINLRWLAGRGTKQHHPKPALVSLSGQTWIPDHPAIIKYTSCKNH